ncbi:hypothetical protein AB0M54_46940 [Actinoplanes sp. NPDC051470]|uniref:hypothetical protein n=1 Tax=unclassified Actinoplanes TaxID=2626549 RepID=UPI003418B0EE
MTTSAASGTRDLIMGWTEADGDALFRQPSDEQAGEGAPSRFEDSDEAMRRRFPFEADPADVAEQGQDVPLDDDEHRR